MKQGLSDASQFIPGIGRSQTTSCLEKGNGILALQVGQHGLGIGTHPLLSAGQHRTVNLGRQHDGFMVFGHCHLEDHHTSFEEWLIRIKLEVKPRVGKLPPDEDTSSNLVSLRVQERTGESHGEASALGMQQAPDGVYGNGSGFPFDNHLWKLHAKDQVSDMLPGAFGHQHLIASREIFDACCEIDIIPDQGELYFIF